MCGDDGLSGLSDDLLSIISLLPTREAVRTALLSRRWRPVWLRTVSLILDTRSYGKQIQDPIARLFSDAAKFLGADGRCGQIRKLCLFVHGHEQRNLVGASGDSYDLMVSLLAAPALQSLEEVRVELDVVNREGHWQREERRSGRAYVLDPALLPGHTLRVLDLVCCRLESPPGSAPISFPSLSSLRLCNCSSSTKDLEGWIRTAPNLGSLHLEDHYFYSLSGEKRSDSFAMYSPSLTTLKLVPGTWTSRERFQYEVDAPLLRTIRYKGTFQALSIKSQTTKLLRVELKIKQNYDQSGKAVHRWFAPFWQLLRSFGHAKAIKLNVPAIEGLAVHEDVQHEHLFMLPALESLELKGFSDPGRRDEAALAFANLLECCPLIHNLQIRIDADHCRTSYTGIDPLANRLGSLDLFEKGYHSEEMGPFMLGRYNGSSQVLPLPGLTGTRFHCLENNLKTVTLKFELKELDSFEVSLLKFFAENCMVLKELRIDEGLQRWSVRDQLRSLVEGWKADAIKRRTNMDSADSSEQGRKRRREVGQLESTSRGENRNGAMQPPPHHESDEGLHRKQLHVSERETMPRLFAFDVLVSGLNGLGAEIAKNLALAGVKSVTIHDVKNVEMWDFSGNFLLSEDDVGKNRAVACVAKLQELNNAVLISALTEELTTKHLSKFQAVVFTDIGLGKAYEFDDYCHNHQPPISFIKSEVCGLFGSVFCDFGPKFTVLDVDGEDPHTGIIASISNDNPALVSCVHHERLGFQDGDLVVFSDVHGMAELNDGKPRKVKNARPFSFSIEEDTSNFGIYIKSGTVAQVKEPKVLCFKALRDAMRDPGDFLLSDFSKFDRSPVLHIAFEALDKFKQDHGRYPAAGCEQDAQIFIRIATAVNEASADRMLDTTAERLFRQFASGSGAVLNPMAAMFGGIVGQEVVKACSGMFHPLYQFFYFDSIESLPTFPLDPQDLKPSNSRYDAQVSIFGSKLQKRLEEANTFVVGSGALGCEFLKNLALMGVSCSSKGKLTITDDDTVEKSNLSRQFLFRDWNIGQAKSTVAATAARAINPSLHIDALQNRACLDTENVFHETFWEGLDIVVNALDNANTRYMAKRCLYFQKPLLESGTLGAKCNTQMVIPHLTANYGASIDPPEKQAPMCTIHSFPHNIDHCLTWARSEFEGLLEKTPNEVNSFLSNPVEYATAMRKAGDAQARELLERVSECLDKERCNTFDDCISWARLKFEDYFSNRVKQLTSTFPEDAATSTGVSFWSAPKRFPRALQFSAADPSHVNFIMSASILRGESNGVAIPEWAKNTGRLVDVLEKTAVPTFKPKKGVYIVTDEKASNLSRTSVEDVAVIDDLLTKLQEYAKRLPPGFQMKPIQLERDDDTNFHMDLIAGLANMRARNYSIPEVDKLNAKLANMDFLAGLSNMRAGRIMPAIATSIAMATGLACLELYKVIAGGHPVEDYRNTFANLALPLVSMAEPVPPKVTKHKDMSWTAWDRWSIMGNPTLAELLQWFADKDLTVFSISYSGSLLYNMYDVDSKRLTKKVVNIAREATLVDFPEDRRYFDIDVMCDDDNGNSVDIPQRVSVYFR